MSKEESLSSSLNSNNYIISLVNYGYLWVFTLEGMEVFENFILAII